jgi:hypothetical protein
MSRIPVVRIPVCNAYGRRSRLAGLLLGCCLPLLLASCGDLGEAPRWETEVLTPLAKSDLDADDILALTDFKGLERSFTVGNFGPLQAGGPREIEPFSASNVGPLSVFLDETPIVSATFTDLTVKISVRNTFPIYISPGTEVILEKPDGTVLAEQALSNEIGPGETTTILEEGISSITITPDLLIRLKNFQSPGSKGEQVVVENSDEFEVRFQLTADRPPKQVRVEGGAAIRLADTADFNLEGDVVNTEAITGRMILFTETDFPIRSRLQGYFLRNDGAFAFDSLSRSGRVAIEQDTSRDTLAFSQARLENLQQARLFASSAFVEVKGDSTQIQTFTRQQSLTVQLVGDLNILVNDPDD